jgi:hypothetical protein
MDMDMNRKGMLTPGYKWTTDIGHMDMDRDMDMGEDE